MPVDEPTFFDDFFDDLEEMEERGTITSDFVVKLDKLGSSFEDFESYWIKEGDAPIQAAFVMYLASRNCRMVLEKIRARLKHVVSSNNKQDNPNAIIDTIKVAPLIFEIYIKLVRARKQTPDIDFLNQKEILALVRSLREAAKSANALPSVDEELKGIDRSIVQQEIVDLDARINMMTMYEYDER